MAFNCQANNSTEGASQAKKNKYYILILFHLFNFLGLGMAENGAFSR